MVLDAQRGRGDGRGCGQGQAAKYWDFKNSHTISKSPTRLELWLFSRLVWERGERGCGCPSHHPRRKSVSDHGSGSPPHFRHLCPERGESVLLIIQPSNASPLSKSVGHTQGRVREGEEHEGERGLGKQE